MSAHASSAGQRDTGAATRTQEARTLTPAELAWIALLPCAVVMLVVILALGPPLGDVLFKPGNDPLWPPTWWNARGHPEPVENARYLLAVLAPLVLAAVVLVGARREPQLPPRVIRALTLTSQWLTLAFVLVGVLGQHDIIAADPERGPVIGIAALCGAALLVVVAVQLLRRPGATERIAQLTRETPNRRRVTIAIVTVFSALWLLEVVTTDGLVEDIGQMSWTVNDAFAVLNGRTPLVDYHILYGKLLPYPAALALAVFGKTGLVYTLLMAVLSLLALVAVFAIFRRIVRSSLLALGLFVPFVALSDISHTMIMPAMWPTRYGAAYLLAWLTARHVDRRSPRQIWILFFVGGLITLNNTEFGMGAVAATAAALLCAAPPPSKRAALRFAGEIAGGIGGAIALVWLFTLLRAGELPDTALLSEWPRIFTRLGWFSLPIPLASLHLAVYATLVAAIATATVRVARGAGDVLLTSMLMWSGVFGLVAAGYYVGRSDDLKLVAMFSAWAFALALLTVVCVRALTARGWRAPTVPELLVLFGFALAICSLVHAPLPNEQIARLTRSTPDLIYRPVAERFVRQNTQPGETVAMTIPEGYRIAYNLGLTNVSPYGIQNAIVTHGQMQTLIDAIERAHVQTVFTPQPGTELLGEVEIAPEQLQMFFDAGFQVSASRPGFLALQRN